jgi:hypothetical protein
MQPSKPMPRPGFGPVIINGDCRGHLIPTCKGWRVFDRNDREIGTYDSADMAVAALLERATAAAA